MSDQTPSPPEAKTAQAYAPLSYGIREHLARPELKSGPTLALWLLLWLDCCRPAFRQTRFERGIWRGAYRQLADELKLSFRVIRYNLEKLEKLGLIRIEEKPRNQSELLGIVIKKFKYHPRQFNISPDKNVRPPVQKKPPPIQKKRLPIQNVQGKLLTKRGFYANNKNNSAPKILKKEERKIEDGSAEARPAPKRRAAEPKEVARLLATYCLLPSVGKKLAQGDEKTAPVFLAPPADYDELSVELFNALRDGADWPALMKLKPHARREALNELAAKAALSMADSCPAEKEAG